jgi:selenocysteine lyase/cysteine desulfurase
MEIAAFCAVVGATTEALRRRREGAPPLPATHDSRYGKACRHYFALNFAYTHLNHGSYGTAPYEVMKKASKQMLRIESFPDDFMRRRALQDFCEASDAAGAEIYRAPRGSTVFVENATAGVNAVLRSLRLQPGESILMTNHTYNACKNAIHDTQSVLQGVQVRTLQIDLPVTTDAALVEQLRAELDAHKDIKFVLLDHITSPTAIVMPVAAMCRLCKERGVRVMVDGAHSPGQMELDIPAIGCDWYVGNLHKWVFALKGVALLYTAPAQQASTQAVIISHFWKRPYQHRFFMQGTNDQSRYLSASDGIAFVKERLGGFESMRAYNHAMVEAGARILCEAWGTERAFPAQLCAPFLVMLEAPLDWRKWVRRSVTTTAADGSTTTHEVDASGLSEDEAVAALHADEGLNERIANAVFDRCGAQSVFFPWKHDGKMKLFNRISAQVYNTEDDYRKLARCVLELKAIHG